jgi:hypothetical protein
MRITGKLTGLKAVTIIGALALVGSLGLPNNAQAISLGPGDGPVAFAGADNITGTGIGALVPGTISLGPYITVVGPVTLSGNLRSAVFDLGGGVRDFLYQVQNTGNAFVLRESSINFTGISLAPSATALGAFFRTDFGLYGAIFVDGTIAPSTGDRSLSGATVGFNFADPGIGLANSEILVIRTTSNTIFPGNSAVIDGLSANIATPSPQQVTVPGIPEPTTILLLGSGLAGLAGWRRWRTKKA